MRWRSRRTWLAVATVAALSSTALVACHKSEDEAGVKKGGGGAGKGGGGARKLEYPVETAPLALRHVQYTISAPGSLEAFQQVQITARVAGAVDKVSFTEGALVSVGDTLVTIESDRYQVAVDQAAAQLQKSKANEKQAEDQLKRRQGAVKDHPGLIAGEEIATYQTTVATAQADVAASNEAVRVAQLNLRDAFVHAPIAGVVQTRTVQVGQYLQPGAVLATILQRDPLLLRFQVSESDAPRLKNGMKAHVALRESKQQYTASIDLVAGAADPTTRLVPVTATLDTTDHQYWLRPGAFCEVTVPIGDARDAIVVPVISVQPTENGNVVWTVENNVARSKQVQVGMYTQDGAVEITKGLAVGETLVVRGLDALVDGAPVKVSDQTTIEAVLASDAGAPTTPPPAASNGGAPGGAGSPLGSGGGPGSRGAGHRDGGTMLPQLTAPGTPPTPGAAHS